MVHKIFESEFLFLQQQSFGVLIPGSAFQMLGAVMVNVIVLIHLMKRIVKIRRVVPGNFR
jgi:hypothetical protein